jgi:hypothetical protein
MRLLGRSAPSPYHPNRCSRPSPAAIITADGSVELKQRARALGYPLLQKPVKPAALRALLASPLRPQASGD